MAVETVRLTSPEPTTLRTQQVQRILRRIRRSTSVAIGSIILLVVIVLAIAGPLFSPYDPIEMDSAVKQPPSAQHLFGTDRFGRDVLTRVLEGGRISLQVGLVSVALASLTGTLLGLLAGYFGGWIDGVISRFVDVLLSFPSILLALVIIAILGKSLTNVMIAVGISTIPFYTRIVRGSTFTAKQMDYITAARVIGCSSLRIMFFHILPNVMAPIIVITTTGIAGAIISGAALSFLGLGVQPPTPEWGVMLSEGRQDLRAAWWIATFPGLAIMFTVMGINLLGDGLRDILDPRLKL